MTTTIMYLAVAFLLAALALSTYVRVRGLEFAHGAQPVATAAILLVVALIADLVAQELLGVQGWLNTGTNYAQQVVPTTRPSLVWWKIGLASQGVAIVFLVLGIWRLFAAVQLINPAGRARVSKLVTPSDVDATS